jgi:hypothetical protein
MDRHICKQCGKAFNYCRSCSFKPIPYKAAGFCSKECSAEFKKPKVEIKKPAKKMAEPIIEEIIPTVEDVEVVIENDKDMTISENE